MAAEPAKNAIVLFAARTLFRSRQHRLIVSFYLGVGCAAVLAYMRIAASGGSVLQAVEAAQNRVIVLSTTILLMCVAVAAIRSVISHADLAPRELDFPHDRKAGGGGVCRRRSPYVFLLGVAPAWILIAIALWSLWPLRVASEHLLVLALFGGCLVELSLAGFVKVPFTCSYLPGKANAHITFWVAVLLLIPLANLAARLEYSLLNHVAGGIFLIVILGIVLVSARWRQR